jgi:hypothetical protein
MSDAIFKEEIEAFSGENLFKGLRNIPDNSDQVNFNPFSDEKQG